jgi:hypothetical protein
MLPALFLSPFLLLYSVYCISTYYLPACIIVCYCMALVDQAATDYVELLNTTILQFGKQGRD